MGFLRRLFGGQDATASDEGSAEVEATLTPGELEAAEREHERDLLDEERNRLDELQQRQLRYADYAWQPPSQGGDRRADDKEEGG
jgi:hypothetical protein